MRLYVGRDLVVVRRDLGSLGLDLLVEEIDSRLGLAVKVPQDLVRELRDERLQRSLGHPRVGRGETNRDHLRTDGGHLDFLTEHVVDPLVDRTRRPGEASEPKPGAERGDDVRGNGRAAGEVAGQRAAVADLGAKRTRIQQLAQDSRLLLGGARVGLAGRGPGQRGPVEPDPCRGFVHSRLRQGDANGDPDREDQWCHRQQAMPIKGLQITDHSAYVVQSRSGPLESK